MAFLLTKLEKAVDAIFNLGTVGRNDISATSMPDLVRGEVS